VATPNEVEAMTALGLSDEAQLLEPARIQRALASAGIDHLIVKRGSKGMIVCGGDGLATVDIAGSPQATDVTGAGDTVAAVVSLALAAGASLVEAARMATFAAAVVVMKRGTATATPDEVRALIDEASP
jgi:D-beta-D-heptose 7-phosphate kinase/D-beta-D-heptose 1-phosphate adenosyltransferase